MIRRMPAQQRLEAERRARHQTDLGLVMQLEFAPGEGIAQRDLQRAARLRLRIDARLEAAVGAAPVRLGLMERKIGPAHQLVGVVAGERRKRDADAGAADDALAVNLERRRERGEDPPGELHGIVGILGTVLDDRKLVAVQSRHQIGVMHSFPQPHRDRAQQRITRRVAERVVDRPEAVQVEAMHGVVGPAPSLGRGGLRRRGGRGIAHPL